MGKVGKARRTVAHKCPHCGAHLDAVTPFGLDEAELASAPDRGSLSVCGKCAGCMRFLADGQWERVTDSELSMMAMDPRTRQLVASVRGYILAWKKRASHRDN